MSCRACHNTGTCQDCGGSKFVKTGSWTNPVPCKRCNQTGKCSSCRGKG
jgi:hypothetical protein